MKFKRTVVALCLVLFGLCVDVSFGLEAVARVDKKQVPTSGSVLLQIEVTGGNGRPDLSGIKDFKTISKGSSSFTQIVNGNITRKMIYQYLLIPQREGELMIPALKVTADGQSAVTDPIHITVIKAALEPEEQKQMFAKASISSQTLFAGQQAVYSLKFYNTLRLSELRFETPPDFKELFAQRFKREHTFRQVVDGVAYRVNQVDYLVIGKNPGKVFIDGPQLIAGVIEKTNHFDPFDLFFSDAQSKPVRVTANPVEIEILPLPVYSESLSFSGLVGQFSIEVKVDKSIVKSGESVTMTIRIAGKGNVMDAGIDHYDIGSNDFKVVDDRPTKAISLTPEGFQGYKEFKKKIVALKPGRFTLPPVRIVYFDVEQKKYRNLVSASIDLTVTPSQKIHITMKQTPESRPDAPG